MTNKSGFPIAAAIAAAIAVAMLIFLFTVPGNYLRDMTAKLRVMTHEAEQAAVLGDMATAAERLDAITREYNSRRDKIKMFFHHDDLDEMEKTLITCRDLVAMGQRQPYMRDRYHLRHTGSHGCCGNHNHSGAVLT